DPAPGPWSSAVGAGPTPPPAARRRRRGFPRLRGAARSPRTAARNPAEAARRLSEAHATPGRGNGCRGTRALAERRPGTVEAAAPAGRHACYDLSPAMPDNVSPQRRSRMMAAVRHYDTAP